MLAKEEDGPPVRTAVEVNRSSCLRKTRFILLTCCGDCLNNFGSGAVKALQTFTDVAFPVIFFLFPPAVGAWIIAGIVALAENEREAVYISAFAFLAWGFVWIFVVSLFVSEDADLGQFKLNLSSDTKLVYFAYGLLRAGLSATGMYRLTTDCLAFEGVLEFESCPTEQVIRYVGYACIFLDPYVFAAFAKWPKYHEENKDKKSDTVLVLTHAVLMLPWAFAGVTGLTALALGLVVFFGFFPALLAVHVGPFVFYISGIIALASEDPLAVDVAVISFLVLNSSYWLVFIFLLQDIDDEADMPWLKKTRTYLRQWPKWGQVLVSAFLILRFGGAISGFVFYVDSFIADPFGDILTTIYAIVITFAVLDPLIIFGVFGVPSFVKYINEVSDRYAEQPLPLASHVTRPK